MAEIDLNIGGKIFRIACADGEERQLEAAASLVANEATSLVSAIGQVPETRMLLMSSLMLGDRHIALQGQLRAAEDRIRALEQRSEQAEAAASASTPVASAATFGQDSAEAIAALTRTAETLEAMADALEATPA
ncbi:cell division protein ZapA [Monaibacterium marinum]|uniref:Cell division protein ZapA n=1 Tax=Pontivivens marinum TaxID=1690039 RepID=A0A2C9CTG0_9RHOB|nr:cell division protein ZapA [Monaibacterium marinum]SOH94518.1 cell division protein ZapA [Monaibacterium marinum]